MAKENYILPQLSELHENFNSQDPFVADAKDFLNTNNISIILDISQRNKSKIAAQIPVRKGHSRWLWFGSSMILLVSIILYLTVPNKNPKDFKAKFQVKKIPSLNLPSVNSVSKPIEAKVKSPQKEKLNQEINETAFNSHSEDEVLYDTDINSDSFQEEEKTSTLNESNPSSEQDNTVYIPLSGEKLSNGSPNKDLERDPSVPLSFSKAMVSKQENYFIYSGGKNFSYEMSDMPQYRGGKSKIESDLTAYLSKIKYTGTFNKKVNAVLTFVIDSKGNMEEINVIGAPNAQVKNEIVKAAQKLGTWSKSSKSGKKGSLYYEIMLSFR